MISCCSIVFHPFVQKKYVQQSTSARCPIAAWADSLASRSIRRPKMRKAFEKWRFGRNLNCMALIAWFHDFFALDILGNAFSQSAKPLVYATHILHWRSHKVEEHIIIKNHRIKIIALYLLYVHITCDTHVIFTPLIWKNRLDCLTMAVLTSSLSLAGHNRPKRESFTGRTVEHWNPTWSKFPFEYKVFQTSFFSLVH